MSAIRDIRVYRSQIENIAGNSLPEGFENKHLHIILHRVAMKLSEHDFSMGDFHHLYVNLTTCEIFGLSYTQSGGNRIFPILGRN